MADQDRKPPGRTGTEPEEDFLSRWSRRKRDASRAEAPPALPEADRPAAVDDADDGPTDADLPPLDSLGPDSDYSAFLSRNVSEHLRQAALRKLFRQPGFNIRDGLDDYDEDYRSFAALGDAITADMRHHRERLNEKARAAERPEGEGDEAPRAGADSGPDREPDAATRQAEDDGTDPVDEADPDRADGETDGA